MAFRTTYSLTPSVYLPWIRLCSTTQLLCCIVHDVSHVVRPDVGVAISHSAGPFEPRLYNLSIQGLKVTNMVSNSPVQKCVPCQVSQSRSSIALLSSPDHPGSSMLVDGHFEGPLTEKQEHYGNEKEFIRGGRSRVTIDMLPDIALLEIFEFYMY